MPVEKLRGEAELASDTNDMKFFFLSVVAFYPARTCSDTNDDFLPEEQYAVTWLPPWWEVRTKVSCGALTSVVGTSKPTLEETLPCIAYCTSSISSVMKVKACNAWNGHYVGP